MATMSTAMIRIEPDAREQTNEVFEELGLSMSAAANIFLKAVVRHKGMSFDMDIDENGENED